MASPITRPRSKRLMATMAALLLAIMLTSAGSFLLRERRAAFEAATTAQTNMALGFESDIQRNLDIYDLSLRAAAEGLLLVNGSMNTAAQRALLFDGSTAAKYFRPIVIADGSGAVKFDSGGETPRIAQIGDRPSFLAQREHDGLGLLVRLNLHSLIDGLPFFSMTRRINGPDGGFAGVVAGGLELAYFHDLFSRFDLPPGAIITLVGYDGQVVAGVPSRDGMASPYVIGAGLVDRARRASSSSFETTRGSDGISQVVTVRRLGSLPYFLAIAIPSDAVYAHWRMLAWRIAAAVFVFTDISALLLLALVREFGRRMRAERDAVIARDAVRASERRLGTYVDHLADGILAVAMGPDGHFFYERVNEAAGRMVGLPPNDIIGRRPRDIFTKPVADLVEARWRECIAASGPTHHEVRLKRRGDTRVLRLVLAPVREGDATGPVTLILASVRDVTEMVALEAQLRQAQRMEAVGRLTAGIAHDFNNLLQTQSGALELLIEDLQDRPGSLEYATMALAASERGGCLTHSLLSFSCQQHLAPRAVPLPALFDGLRQLLPVTLGHLIDLQIQTGEATDSAYADRAQLETAILNLCCNARDAMPDGGVLTIHAWNGSAAEAALAGMAPVDAVVLAVSDTGSGMAADVTARACEPFFSTKAVGKGSSGLGLSMVLGFVQQSGGAMRIRSNPGDGTCVELWLPRAACAEAFETVGAVQGGEPGLLTAGHGQRGREAANGANRDLPRLPGMRLTGHADADEPARPPPYAETVRNGVQADRLATQVNPPFGRFQAASQSVAAH